MKCPSCGIVASDKRDLCPKCKLDLRPHKKGLGIAISHPNLGQKELEKLYAPKKTRGKRKVSRKKKGVRKRTTKPGAQPGTRPSPSKAKKRRPRPTPPKEEAKLNETPQTSATKVSWFSGLVDKLVKLAPAKTSETSSADIPIPEKKTPPETASSQLAQIPTEAEAKPEPFNSEPVEPPITEITLEPAPETVTPETASVEEAGPGTEVDDSAQAQPKSHSVKSIKEMTPQVSPGVIEFGEDDDLISQLAQMYGDEEVDIQAVVEKKTKEKESHKPTEDEEEVEISFDFDFEDLELEKYPIVDEALEESSAQEEISTSVSITEIEDAIPEDAPSAEAANTREFEISIEQEEEKEGEDLLEPADDILVLVDVPEERSEYWQESWSSPAERPEITVTNILDALNQSNSIVQQLMCLVADEFGLEVKELKERLVSRAENDLEEGRLEYFSQNDPAKPLVVETLAPEPQETTIQSPPSSVVDSSSESLWTAIAQEIDALNTDSPSEIEVPLSEMSTFVPSDQSLFLFDMVEQELESPTTPNKELSALPSSEQASVDNSELTQEFSELEAAVMAVIEEQEEKERRWEEEQGDPNDIENMLSSSRKVQLAKLHSARAISFDEIEAREIDTLANPIRRLVAKVVDLSIATVLGFTLTSHYQLPEYLWEELLALNTSVWPELLPFIFHFLSYTFGSWFAVNTLYVAAQGRTIGKELLKVSVTNGDGEYFDFRESFIRMLSELVTLLTLGLGLLPIFGKQRQTLHDRLVRSVVVPDY